MKKLLLALTACVCLGGCLESVAKADTTVVVVAPAEAVEVVTTATVLPPPPVVEVIPRRPSVRYVWVGGYWHWTNRWLWMPGRYVVRVPGHVWVGHRYYMRGRVVVHVRGYWRR